MYRVDRNNFHINTKNACIHTPERVSKFLFDVLSPFFKIDSVILDPCSGAGSLLWNWHNVGYKTIAIDITDQGYPSTIVKNYLEVRRGDIPMPSLVVTNPPFNVEHETKKIMKSYVGRPLLPEVWLKKTIELFGKEVPMVLFTPYGLRLNITEKSRRWKMFVEGEYPSITSIISLPKNAFDNILFHSEILCFNLPDLKPHYFVYSS